MFRFFKKENVITILLIFLIFALIFTRVGFPNTQPVQEKRNESSTAIPTKSATLIEEEIERVKQEGYSVIDGINTWNPSESLNVLIGACTGAEGYCKKAFFFYNGNYLGTDTSDPSSQISFVWRTNDTVALNYVLYHKEDPMCCPTAGAATVRFKWDGNKLVALDPIPSSGDVDNSRR